LGESNSFIRLVTIDRYIRPRGEWKPPADSTVAVIARLRNGAPLAVERKLGAGRVVVFLTSLTPDWNNWTGDPSFIVMQLKLESYLATTKRTDESHLVGTPLTVNLEADKFQSGLKFVAPGSKANTRIVIERTAVRPQENSPVWRATLGLAAENSSDGETDRAGVYEAWPMTTSGAFEPRRFAFNVDPVEGDLSIVDPQQLLGKLAPVKAQFHPAEEYDWDFGEQRGFNRSLFLMGLLICLLLGEQLLAYSASYHPPQTSPPAATGVVR
jgi:hypothetical protein